MATSKTYIFDFDSTLVQVETLEILAEIALAQHPEKAGILSHIQQITNDAMEGRYSYQESLSERMAMLPLKPEHILQAITVVAQKITPSIARNSDFFKKNADHIYVFSGAFIEIVWPVVSKLGLHRDHVFGNRLLYDFEGNIYGYDQQYPLAQDNGKVKLAQRLKLSGDITIIGDGYNDYELKEAGYVQTFIAFTENIKRDNVVKVSDAVINELEGLFIIHNLPYTPPQVAPKALFLENIHPFVKDYFIGKGFEVESINGALADQALIDKLANVNLLGIRSKTEITDEIIKAAPHLQAIGAFCIGTNQINLNTSSANGVAVFNAPFSNTRSVVELAIAEIIMLVRRAAASSHQLHQGKWHKSAKSAHEVRGKILGIIGYGHIGAQLSIIAESLGMQVIFYDLVDKLPLGNAKACNTLDYLLENADVVSLHIDGRDENRNFITEKEIAKMKFGAIFLNLSRDFTVDYAALQQAMEQGKIAGVGIDVFPKEPLAGESEFTSPFQQFDNVILTPHIGGSTEEAQYNIGEYVSKNLYAYFQNGTTSGSVNFPLLSLPLLNHPTRIIHIHENMPGILAQINSLFAKYENNIEGQFLKTNENIGYCITDINQPLDDNTELLKALESIPHTIKVRIINNS